MYTPQETRRYQWSIDISEENVESNFFVQTVKLHVLNVIRILYDQVKMCHISPDD